MFDSSKTADPANNKLSTIDHLLRVSVIREICTIIMTSSIYIKLKVCLSVCLSAIEIKLETFRYKQTYESYITYSREAKYGTCILISIRIVYGGLRAYIYSTYINSFTPKFKKIQLQTTNRMLERFIYKRFCLNQMYGNNCAHARHFCYCRYIYRRGSERIKIACR